MPFFLALANLVALRTNLRRGNLYDTYKVRPKAPPPEQVGVDFRTARTVDGSYNDLADPAMGMVDTRFGRNVPIARTFGEAGERLMTPNPRLVSQRLMQRETFIPATTLNVLAAAWLQFMIHDWFSHGTHDKAKPFVVPLPEGDDWPEKEMTVLRTAEDPTRGPVDEGSPQTFLNTATHWWDASQIYGSRQIWIDKIRVDPETGERVPHGKIYLDANGHLPIAEDGIEFTGVSGNWWIGLSVLHTLFAKEHNAIVDRLRIDYPQMSDDELFNKARLINAALLAKIHTVEWTPALLGTPELRMGMRGNWWGLLGEDYYLDNGRASDSEVISGIPGSSPDHHAAPYAITEEFVAVYRMHPLLPDDFSFRAVKDNRLYKECGFAEVSGTRTHELYRDVPLVDALYSLGTRHPGAITLHNYPTSLRKLVKHPGSDVALDVATIDILRDRERGVPRYNEFRRSLDMKPVTSFEELTANKTWAEEIRTVYDGDIEAVDLQVGLFAENPPTGFAFSDTAFRIFILMASRRLKSDRFFTSDYRPEVYTPIGMDWIDRNSMRTVLIRHHPELKWSLDRVKNAFAPWPESRIV